MTTKNKNQFNNSKETYTLEMQILTNFSKSKPTLLTKDMLVISEQDKREGEKVSLDTYPLFTYQVEYPVSKLRSIVNYQDRINVFLTRINLLMLF